MDFKDNKLSQYPSLLMDWLCAGEIGLIAYAYSFPAVIFLGDRLFRLSDRQTLLRTLNAYRAVLLRHGLHHARVKIVNKPKWMDRRFHVTARNSYFDEHDHKIGTSLMHFFVAREFFYPSIKMVEVEQWPFPDEIAASPELKALESSITIPSA